MHLQCINHCYKTWPGPADWPGTRSTQWLDRSGFSKRSAVETARSNPGDPAGRLGTRANPVETRCFFFFKCGIWNPLVYILYVPKKKVMFFQCGIWNPFIYILHVPMKKVMFFLYGIWNPLVYILYVPKKKNNVLSMWDKKHFGLNNST